MTKKVLTNLLIGGFILGLCSTANAGKPQIGGAFVGNGFPSGPHFNLNIKAKNPATFTCPPQEDVMKYFCPDVGNMQTYGTDLECDTACTADCISIYGNVINFPQGDGSDNFTILMESGKVKPKGKPTEPQNYPDLLEVTDWCMGFENNDNAAFRLPADPDGYAVYARLTGDPKEDPAFDFTNPVISYVEDSNQDLLWLGYVSNGVFNPAGDDIGSISRTKGKGVSKGTDITPLFMWSGDVCTFIDQGDGGVPTDQCCIDADTHLDGDPSNNDSANVVEGAPDGIYEECVDPIADLCEEGYTAEVVYCTIFDDPVWVFNIAEFVGMLFDIDPDGAYKASLLQIRFYPLPLNVKEQQTSELY